MCRLFLKIGDTFLFYEYWETIGAVEAILSCVTVSKNRPKKSFGKCLRGRVNSAEESLYILLRDVY